MQMKTILRRWARAWVDECAKYATWEHEHHFADSPVGYSERTLMAHLVRAWPFGGARARYLPLLAEFPTPRRKTLAEREKQGRARIPDLWFAASNTAVQERVTVLAPRDAACWSSRNRGPEACVARSIGDRRRVTRITGRP